MIQVSEVRAGVNEKCHRAVEQYDTAIFHCSKLGVHNRVEIKSQLVVAR